MASSEGWKQIFRTIKNKIKIFNHMYLISVGYHPRKKPDEVESTKRLKSIEKRIDNQEKIQDLLKLTNTVFSSRLEKFHLNMDMYLESRSILYDLYFDL